MKAELEANWDLIEALLIINTSKSTCALRSSWIAIWNLCDELQVIKTFMNAIGLVSSLHEGSK